MKFFRFFSKKDCSRFTDNELLDMLRSGGQEQEKALECLHDRFWDLFSRALDFHISDAESLYEAYADALFALRDRVQADRYQGTGILKAYFAIIFRNKCVDVFRRSTTKITAEDIRKISDVLGLDESTAAADAEMLRQEEETTQDAAQMVTKACLDKAKSVLTEKELCVLTQYRINELRAAEVARICGYRNARVVATVALNAQRKLHESIQQLCRDEPRCQLLCRKSNNQ